MDKGERVMGLLGFLGVVFIICIIIDMEKGSSCVSGFITGVVAIGISIGIVVFAFRVNPVLGVIAILGVVGFWKHLDPGA